MAIPFLTVKKTGDEARAWFRQFVELVAKFCGQEIPPYVYEPEQELSIRYPRVAFVYKERTLMVRPYVRVQGDEASFNWEPNDGGLGNHYRGDEVTLSYDQDRYLHDCPSCECSTELADIFTAYTVEQAKEWLDQLEVKCRHST